jgi:hypothetical protein
MVGKKLNSANSEPFHKERQHLANLKIVFADNVPSVILENSFVERTMAIWNDCE